MNPFRKTRLWLRALLKKDGLDAEMDQEMRAHIELQTRENIAAGMAPEEARRAALILFGSAESIQETCRQERGIAWAERLWRDCHHVFRMLRKTPGFTAVAVLTLALGIGVNLALFTLLYAQFWHPKPVPHPEEIWSILPADDSGEPRFFNLSRPYYEAIRQHDHTFKDLVAGATCVAKLRTADGWEDLRGAMVSANWFSFCAVQPAFGRWFLPAEDAKPGAAEVAVIGFRLWQQQFNGDPRVVGKTLSLSQHPLEIIGVAPPQFQGAASFEPDFYVPLSLEKLFSPGASLSLLGRLKDDVTPAQAATMLAPLVQEVTQELHRVNYTIDNVPEAAGNNSMFTRVALLRAGYGSVGRRFAHLRRAELLKVNGLAGFASLLVLIIGVLNLASLLLARALGRRRELATRQALGAPRWALVRQLSFEGLWLAGLGTAAALLILACFHQVAPLLLPSSVFDSDIPAAYLRPDLRVVACSAVFALAVGVGFSLPPALYSTRFHPFEALKESHAGVGIRAHGFSWQQAMVVGQAAGSLVLLSGAWLCLRAISTQLHQNVGFRPERLAMAQANLEKIGYTTETAVPECEEIKRRLSAVPGVELVTMIDERPFTGRGYLVTLHLDGHEGIQSEFKAFNVGPRFFETLGIPLRQGREITEADLSSGRHVMLVNESFVRKFWPNQPVLGKQIERLHQRYELIGVVQDARLESPAEPPKPTVFFAAAPYHALYPTFVVRTKDHPNLLQSIIRNELASVDPRLRGGLVCTLQEAMGAPFAAQRKTMSLLAELAAVALSLTALGTYGMMSYLVTRRAREIGIRRAVGAQRHDVAKLILQLGLRLAAEGVAFGLPVAFLGSLYLRHVVVGVSPFDLPSFLAATGVVLVGMLSACLVPALRATQVDPMILLKYE